MTKKVKKIRNIPEADKTCAVCAHAEPIEGKTKVLCVAEDAPYSNQPMQKVGTCSEWKQ